MTLLTSCEHEKRGCYYCKDITRAQYGQRDVRLYCIHDECPYRVLDKYETYQDYLNSPDSRIDALMR